MPSRVRKPCERSVAALRGRPASTTSTLSRARPRFSAAHRPAGPPPMTRASTATSECSAMGILRRERFDDGVVLVDDADLGGAAGRSDVVEELDVGPVVVRPLLGKVVLVVDRLHRA